MYHKALFKVYWHYTFLAVANVGFVDDIGEAIVGNGTETSRYQLTTFHLSLAEYKTEVVLIGKRLASTNTAAIKASFITVPIPRHRIKTTKSKGAYPKSNPTFEDI